MEVHHHAHTARKKWTHYFWEFLMLFLAVFCGFLAEYQLEHKIEKEREKKYMISMVRDLVEDTAKLNRVISRNIDKFNNMDSLIRLLNLKQISEVDEERLYEMYFQSVGIFPFMSNDRTSRQLISSGNMRLIRSSSVADEITDYYGPNKEFTQSSTADITHFTYEANLFSQDIFEFSAAQIVLHADSTLTYDFNPEKMKLLTKDPAVLKKYANKNGACRALLGNHIQHLIKLKKQAVFLIALLKNEYRLSEKVLLKEEEVR